MIGREIIPCEGQKGQGRREGFEKGRGRRAMQHLQYGINVL